MTVPIASGLLAVRGRLRQPLRGGAGPSAPQGPQMPQSFVDLRNAPVIPRCHYGPTETGIDADPCDRFDAS